MSEERFVACRLRGQVDIDFHFSTFIFHLSSVFTMCTLKRLCDLCGLCGKK
jgi:hypothetical protein